jgi:DNA-directed RNA polymerase specialized sigma24 family protein
LDAAFAHERTSSSGDCNPDSDGEALVAATMAKNLRKCRKAYHRPTPSEEQAIKLCYENGERVKDIARRFDVGWSTVTRIAGRHKLARRGNVAFKRRLAA